MELLPIAILHIPHASRVMPEDFRQSFCLSDEELEAEIIRLADSFTDELFDCNSRQVTRVISPVSRLVVDMERFTDDAQEPMSKFGMGVVYTKTTRSQPLRLNLTNKERESFIQRYYQPHHQKLTDAVNNVLTGWGKCLIVDCHSFPKIPFEYEEDQSLNRPDICIGTDSYHTPQWLTDLTLKLFSDAGFETRINTPFSGSIVPFTSYHANPQVYSVMIEVNRSLYMDEVTRKQNQNFKPLKDRLEALLLKLIEEFKCSNKT